MIRRPPRSTQSRSSAASDVYKKQLRLSATQTGSKRQGRGMSSKCTETHRSHSQDSAIEETRLRDKTARQDKVTTATPLVRAASIRFEAGHSSHGSAESEEGRQPGALSNPTPYRNPS
eukprot:TRINITY_DN1695_c0_g1_i1.p1 TRINITY_DN1695_c0_g1~~TRINITY_DN1695_c0_g1_i1.p1  ORF type:complete len:118 (+),score=26.27 TRINITY_DN1695_c0_g1_i1:103-456(+)